MTLGFFPPRIRTIDEALDFLPFWAEVIGGEQRDGLVMSQVRDSNDVVIGIRVKKFHIDFSIFDAVLTVGMRFDANLVADLYTFDLRTRDGRLLWREDNHPGHEHQHDGPHHLHIGPEENHRAPASPVSLEMIATKVVATFINLR